MTSPSSTEDAIKEIRRLVDGLRPPATSAALTLSASADSLTVEVVDNGRATGAWHPGTGITSMRERAALVGGTLIAGDGRVVATLPL